MSSKLITDMSNFRAIFDDSPGLYLILDPDLVIVEVNKAYAAATMTRRDEIIGRHLFEVFPDNPNDPVADGVLNLRASLNYVLAHKEAHKMADQKYDIRRPDGIFEVRYWSPLNKPVLDDNGNVMYIIHSVVDVTGRVVAEEKSLQAEMLLSSCIESLTDTIILSVDRDYRYINFNSAHKTATKHVYGIDIENGMSLLGHITLEEDRIRAKRNLDKALAGESHITVEEFGEVERLFFETRYHPIRNGKNEIVGASAFAINVTESKKAEEAMVRLNNLLTEANQNLESFSYSVSHDLKAPLRSMQGFSRALIENYQDKLDEDASRWLQFIDSNASRMGTLIDDILGFAKISRMETKMEAVNMKAIFEEVLRQESLLYPRLKVELVAGELLPVTGDRAMIRQIWQNLVSNAFKYASKNEWLKLEVSSESRDKFNIYKIKDNGVGFDNKYVDKIFGVFQRLHTSEDFEGTGVGMAIVHRIIQKHNGWIKAHGEMNKGAEFSFALPNQ